MVAKITGYKKGVSKNGKNYARISYLRSSKFDGEVGELAESNFIPSYLIDKLDSYVGKVCSMDLQKNIDSSTQKATYSISNIEVINSTPDGSGWYL